MCFLRGMNYVLFLSTLLKSRGQPPFNFRVEPRFFLALYVSSLKMEAAYSSEKSISALVTTRCRTDVKVLKTCTHFQAPCFRWLTHLEWLAGNWRTFRQADVVSLHSHLFSLVQKLKWNYIALLITTNRGKPVRTLVPNSTSCNWVRWAS
jgi:hypothetical protein